MFDLYSNLDAIVNEREKLLGWEFPELPSDGNTPDMKQEYDLCYLLIASIEVLAPPKQWDIDHPWCYLAQQCGLEDTDLSRKGISIISSI